VVQTRADAVTAHLLATQLCQLLPFYQKDLASRTASSILWALGAMGTRSSPAVDALDFSLKALGRGMGDAAPLTVSNAAWALAAMWEQVRGQAALGWFVLHLHIKRRDRLICFVCSLNYPAKLTQPNPTDTNRQDHFRGELAAAFPPARVRRAIQVCATRLCLLIETGGAEAEGGVVEKVSGRDAAEMLWAAAAVGQPLEAEQVRARSRVHICVCRLCMCMR
jgi:hypothetical protein